MFGKKSKKPAIDPEQLELIRTAEKRIRQKKRLYTHFVIFLIGAVFLIVANTILGIGKDVKIAGLEWFVIAVGFWFFLFVYHFITVFVTNSFMGEAWEKKQREALVAKQHERIEALKKEYLKEEKEIAKSEIYNERLEAKSSNKETDQELTIIVAAGENNAIGKDNDLIWHLSNDLKRFKKLTNGHHIIMGRKTFESFPKPLPNRTHIVITRQDNYKVPEGVIVVNSLEEGIKKASSDAQPFIIGGGEIYKQSMPLADKIELTRVHATFEDADTFFPEVNDTKWKEIDRRTHDADDKHAHAFSFITYIKR